MDQDVPGSLVWEKMTQGWGKPRMDPLPIQMCRAGHRVMKSAVARASFAFFEDRVEHRRIYSGQWIGHTFLETGIDSFKEGMAPGR